MTTAAIADHHIRQQAIDPNYSYIIQAPAGSGKTELLAQRYLNLLATAVKNPEEIIAITFTRKAAAEMRERIIHALEFANDHAEPLEPHKKITWHLAKNVLNTDKKNNWQLLSNANRLRILTIDALSAMISAQVPLLSGFGAKPLITNNAYRYYRQSVTDLLDQPQHLQDAIEKLLLHFDNNAEQLTTLLIQLLAKREQWLPHIFHHHQDIDAFKKKLQQNLCNIITETLQRAKKSIPFHCQFTLIELAQFGAQQLQKTEPNHGLCLCLDLSGLPKTEADNLTQWRALAELLLTQKFEWRKTIDKRNGFPADKKPQKKQMLELLSVLSKCDSVKKSMVDIIQCPPAYYTEQQWEIIAALIQVLPQLIARLHIQFQQHGTIDFVELTLGALRALGEEDQPTDLALYLDYQIQHILVDEFQDTSVTQFNLLQRLIQEWSPHDGKTLFLVGDPMQSIYRFRNAEVGLFLQAQNNGIANIQLHPLHLTQNFRSEKLIIDWVNNHFSTIFPREANTATGAVPYSPSVALKPTTHNASINYHAALTTDTVTTPQKITALIQQLQTTAPEESIAVLVRSRSQLFEIIPALNQQKIPYQAVELEILNYRPEIRDLVSLTRALLHWDDRIAWLSLLRAPWAGIRLTDLHCICQAAGKRPLWSVLKNFSLIPQLSEDAQLRLPAIVAQLTCSLQEQGRASLPEWVKGTWRGLMGHAALTNLTEHNNANRYFQLLEEIQYDFSFDLLEQKLKQLYAKPDYPQEVKLQLMTIHKAKGLEFDHVILPELQKMTPAEPNALLMWLEYPNHNKGTDLVLAPIKANHEVFDPIHRYLKQLENAKLEFELARLFYVAITRAKKTLHLFCRLSIKEETGEIQEPLKNTFLNLLWSNDSAYFLAKLQLTTMLNSEIICKPPAGIKRLTDDWLKANSKEGGSTTPALSNYQSPPDLYQQHSASVIGTVIHEALQHKAQPTLAIKDECALWQRRLLQLGLSANELPEAIERVMQAISNTLADSRGSWILRTHHDAKVEYALTVSSNKGFQTYIIDRCFVADDVRWIIDYKSATPHEQTMDDFLQQQRCYHEAQLADYAHAFSLLENRPIKLGLYFPLCQAWVEWEYQGGQVLA